MSSLNFALNKKVCENFVTELSTDTKSPGVLRIFGDSVRPGARYKSVLASFASTGVELVKEALCRYQIPNFKLEEFVLCEVIQKISAEDDVNANPEKTIRGSEYVRLIDSNEKPLVLQELWRPIEGYTRRFEIRRRSDVLSLVQTDHVTTGLNYNARRIQISKVKRGVIPNEDKLSNDTSDASNNYINDVIIESNNNSYYTDRHSDLPKAPSQSPYLLTIRGFDIRRDKLYYLVSRDDCTVGGMLNGRSNASIILNSPDVLSRHCSLTRRKLHTNESAPTESHTIVEIQPECDAKVCVNGWAIYSRIVLASGDLIAIGDHYLFVYKDLTSGMDVPTELPWLHECPRNPTPQLSPIADVSEPSELLPRNAFQQQQFKPIRDPDRQTDLVVHPNASHANASDVPMFRYQMDREDELIGEVIKLSDIENDTYKLAPSVLFSMCIQYSLHSFGLAHTNRLVSRMLSRLREKVLKCSAALSEEGVCSSNSDEHQPRDMNCVRPSLYWLSNCVHFYHFVNFRVFSDGSGYREEPILQESMNTILRQFEEIIKFGFQQAVYSTTKVLYYVLPYMINGKAENEDESQSDVLQIVDASWLLAKELRLNAHVVDQFVTYIFFFINTSCFNKILGKDKGSTLFTQSSGERLRSGLAKLEWWAAQHGMKCEFDEMFAPYMNLVTLLATPFDVLKEVHQLYLSWNQLKHEYICLSPSQLHKLLDGYSLPGDMRRPEIWNCANGEKSTLNDGDNFSLKLKDHPTFSVPTEGDVCVMEALSDKSFEAKLVCLTVDFGLREDDEDSGYDAVPPPSSSMPTKHNPPRYPSVGKTLTATQNDNQSDEIRKKHCKTDHDKDSNHMVEIKLSYTSSDAGSNVSANQTATSKKVRTVKKTDSTSPSRHSNKLSASGYCVGNAYYDNFRLVALATPVDRTDSEVSAITKNAASWDDLTYYSTVAYCECVNGEAPAAVIEAPAAAIKSPDVNTPAIPVYNDDSSVTNMSDNDNTGDIIRVDIQRGATGLGLGLIDGLHTPLKKPGLYIRNLLDDGPAKATGRLCVGDRLVAVNNGSLLDDDYFSAMSKIRQAGIRVSLTVAKATTQTKHHIFSTLC